MSTLILFDFVSYCFALGFVENHAISGEILWFKINLPRKQKTLSHPDLDQGVQDTRKINFRKGIVDKPKDILGKSLMLIWLATHKAFSA